MFSFLNPSYHILDRLSSLRLAAFFFSLASLARKNQQLLAYVYFYEINISYRDQPTPESLCSSGGGALTDPRSSRSTAVHLNWTRDQLSYGKRISPAGHSNAISITTDPRSIGNIGIKPIAQWIRDQCPEKTARIKRCDPGSNPS